MTPTQEKLLRRAIAIGDSAAIDRMLEEASSVGHQRRLDLDARHAAFHGHDSVQTVKVERRRGYRGRTVCADCYRGQPFPEEPWL